VNLPAAGQVTDPCRGEAGTQDVSSQAFEGLWLIRFHGRAAVGLKAAVAPLRDFLGKLGTEAGLFDHHGQDLLAESGAKNVRVESGNGLEGFVTFAPGPVGQQAVQVEMPVELVAIEAVDSVKERGAFRVFERAFQELGLPAAMRTDNGVPFASPNGLFGLSRLAVWWLRLGIRIERIKPGHPEQNGRHERLHLTLKKATVVPAANNLLQQQERFNAFQTEYNTERPHEALGMKFPAEVYTPAPRPYRGIGRVEYPMHDRTVTVTSCGRICMKGKKINLSTVFAGQDVGIKEVKEKIWLVSFMEYDLGYFDEDSRRFEPLQNPFGAKVLPMSSE